METTLLPSQTATQLRHIFENQRKNTLNVSLSTADERIAKLKKMQAYTMAHLADIEQAMFNDFCKPKVEVLMGEVFGANSEIKHTIKHLKQWMKPQRVPTPLNLIGTSAFIKHEAKGNVLIISPWNYPFSLAIKPLISAIAAGNVAIVKPSEMTPHTSAFLKKMLSDLFTENEVAVVEGDASTATELLKLPFNHIFFTGAPAIGKIVMRAAADHLASVTLELGGKSPSIIDETADIPKIARMTAWGKCLNNGQTCIAPDYMFVHASKKDEFLSEYQKAVTQFYQTDGQAVEQSDSYARIVNARHFNRLKGYLDDAVAQGANVAMGGKTNADQNFIEPTVLTGVNDQMKVMQEEVFGPLLPVLTYQHPDEVINYVNSKEKPLALYINSRSQKNIDYFLNRTTAGDTVINDVLLQFGHSELPFGGVNNSGIGKSNGFFGFQEFSNQRGVMKRQFGDMKFIYPPYTPKVKKIVDFFVKYF
ncbi:MAG: aldehyde dehydrogenase family protein [Runella slithyformis]|nr:MAG: aldehyde dehydrogenase family protein [Runella slithyformis]